MNCIVPYSYRLMKIFMIVLFVTFFLLTISTTYIYVHSENSTITTERGDVECTCLNADSISAYSFILSILPCPWRNVASFLRLQMSRAALKPFVPSFLSLFTDPLDGVTSV